MILGWPPFKIVSVSAVLYPRWPPLLKIEISSNGQNCYILSQKVPKFELYKHNDELFNIYYRIFYELWTFAYFDRLCKLEKKGGWNLKKIFSSETTEPISTKLCWNDSWVVLFQNCRAEPPDTFLEENHPMTISSKFCSYWANGFRQEDFYGNFP
jgi:hypothetical protein